MNKQAIEATQRMIERDKMFKAMFNSLLVSMCPSCKYYYIDEPCGSIKHEITYKLIRQDGKLL